MTTHIPKKHDGSWNTLCGRLADPLKHSDGRQCKTCRRLFHGKSGVMLQGRPTFSPRSFLADGAP